MLHIYQVCFLISIPSDLFLLSVAFPDTVDVSYTAGLHILQEGRGDGGSDSENRAQVSEHSSSAFR